MVRIASKCGIVALLREQDEIARVTWYVWRRRAAGTRKW